MNISFFIASRLFNSKENKNSYTKPIIRIAILAISLSISLMMISIIVLNGFKKEIYSKVVGFSSHIKVLNFSDNQSFENDPIDFNQKNYNDFIINPNISNVQIVATKAGIIKSKDEILGVVLKGVSTDYDFSFLKENLVSGKVLSLKDDIIDALNEIVISRSIAKSLGVSVGDEISMYFMQNPVRVRKFTISGIYNTGLVEFDDVLIFGDIKHVQKLNNWSEKQIGSYEISLHDFASLDSETQKIYDSLDFNLNATNIKESYPQIFDWLALQDLNVLVIIILMLIVGSVNMITALLIIILEKTQFIGLLKSLGANNKIIRNIFLYNSLYLVSRGLFFGNIIALGFAFLQKNFSLFKLNEEIYFMSKVPISIDLLPLLYLNIGTFVICYLFLIIPSYVITKISPIKALRFE